MVTYMIKNFMTPERATCNSTMEQLDKSNVMRFTKNWHRVTPWVCRSVKLIVSAIVFKHSSTVHLLVVDPEKRIQDSGIDGIGYTLMCELLIIFPLVSRKSITIIRSE